MLAGLILPTAGRVTIDRVDISESTADLGAGDRSDLLTEAPGLWERLTCASTCSPTRGCRASTVRSRAGRSRLLEQVELADRADELAGKLSKGLQAARSRSLAPCHRPPMLLLDEPTSGLDPASARHVRDLILGLRQRAAPCWSRRTTSPKPKSSRIASPSSRRGCSRSTPPPRCASGGAGFTVAIEFEDGEARQSTFATCPRFRSSFEAWSTRASESCASSPDRRSLEDVYLSLVGDREFGWTPHLRAGAQGRARVDSQPRRHFPRRGHDVRVAVPGLPRDDRRADVRRQVAGRRR